MGLRSGYVYDAGLSLANYASVDSFIKLRISVGTLIDVNTLCNNIAV